VQARWMDKKCHILSIETKNNPLNYLIDNAIAFIQKTA
jgi:hypothetical protein